MLQSRLHIPILQKLAPYVASFIINAPEDEHADIFSGVMSRTWAVLFPYFNHEDATKLCQAASKQGVQTLMLYCTDETHQSRGENSPHVMKYFVDLFTWLGATEEDAAEEDEDPNQEFLIEL